MKKYFTKISASFLLTTIFFMVGSFCFHDLFGSVFMVEAAHAASFKSNVNIKIDTCTDTLNFYRKEINKSVTNIDNQTSLSSCCDPDYYPSVILPAHPMFEINKVIPSLSFDNYESVKTILISAVYYKQLSSPPELLALRSTILRI